MGEECIEKFDFVRIHYNDGSMLKGMVLNVPVDVGDSWHILTDDGKIIYQNPASTNFDKVVLQETVRE